MSDTTAAQPQTVSEAQRTGLLNSTVAGYARKGWSTESITAFQAVLVKTKRIGFFLNLILVLFTGGLWLIYIIYRALNRKTSRVVLYVNELGQLQVL